MRFFVGRAGFQDFLQKTEQIAVLFAVVAEFAVAVQTNSVFHTVGMVFTLPTGAPNGAAGAAPILAVWPNPLRDHTVLRLENNLLQAPFRMELIDIQGKCVRRAPFSSPEYLIRRDNLPPGIYLHQVKTADGRLPGQGKIVTQ